MGTKVESKSSLPGHYYSMRDMNEDSKSSTWPLFYTDKPLPNGQYYNGFTPRTVTGSHDKNVLKQKMLEHEDIFMNQVYELHRLYRIQRDMMEEVKQKELHKRHISIDTSSSSSFLPLQIPPEDPRKKWQIPSFPLPSALGADVINSPLSCTKGYNTTQAGAVPSQNGWSSKDCEILDSRPSKVRKKLFDLELPADEYIDTEEGGQLEDNKVSDTTSKSESRFRSSIGFADLNAPVQVEATAGPTSVDFLGSSRGLDVAARSKLPFLGLPYELVPNFQHGSNNGISSNRSIEDNKGNGREWFSNISEPGNSKSNLNCIPGSFQSDKLPISSHQNGLMFNKSHHQPVGILTTDHNRGIKISDRTRNHCNYNHPEAGMASCIPSPYPFVNSTDPLSNSWSHSVSSWGKQSTSVQTHRSFNSSVSWGRNSQPCDQSHEILGDRWQVNGDSRSNSLFASEPTTPNGFYYGFPSGSKELMGCFPSSGFDYPNCHKGTKFMDLKSMIPNLITKISSNEAVPCKDLEVIDKKEKCRDRLASLPWLRAKPISKNEGSGTRSDPISVDLGFFQASSSNNLCGNGTLEGPRNVNTKDVASASSGSDVDASKRRILGFPVFENRCASKNDSSPSEGEDIKVKGKRRLIDINVACDPTVLEENEEFGNFSNRIDLNSCVSEDEDALAPCVARENPNRRIAVEIDLEAPIVQESEESTFPEEEQKQNKVSLQSPQHVVEHPEDEFVRTAAESIVAMSASSQHQHIEESASHPSEASLEDSLLWFADIVSSCAGDLDRKADKESREGNDGNIEESPTSEFDYFEAMTLQLIETKEEDYMPKPLVPETRDPEENEAVSAAGRTRKGQSRRGRQRRDFQRDILPGLTSLARHEVTEDLQTFGGLMKAMGHNWQSGLARRNGGAAGRRRRRPVVVELASPPTPPVCTSLMEHLQNSEVGLEDRSLTGWGKTTRRPRRQRCPAAGNPLAIALT